MEEGADMIRLSEVSLGSTQIGARVPDRVGAGVVEMMGGGACAALVPDTYGDACVALGGGAIQPRLVIEPSSPSFRVVS
jgi:hypothetical protein